MSLAADDVPAAGDTTRVLQRIIYPRGESLDVLPLYVETNIERGAGLTATSAETTRVELNAAVPQAQPSVRFGETAPDGSRRRTAIVSGGERISFATYFNAFPAGYWRRWTTVEQVGLRVQVAGEATLIVYRSTARGRSHPVHTVRLSPEETQSVTLPLPLDPFIDGGWYWFDILSGPDGAALVAADWTAQAEAPAPRGVSIGITTFNRPEFVVELLRSLGEATDVLAVLDRVYLVDQGSDHPSDQADFAEATKKLGDRLSVIRQANLGGSGGFSRAMAETLDAGESDYVLLLDDDVVLEPEGVLRALTFARFARTPTIVGGHMFSLHDRSVLNAFAETVRPYKFLWGAAAPTKANHDLGRQGLRHTPWLHRRVDADYNGWWMCLIPVPVIAELGLSLPAFIKWDDAEYGLRAGKAGHRTVSLPGVAVWHVPWHDKNDAVDWQAYYHIRNRLIAALLHSPYPRGGRVVAESMEIQIQHLLSMQYSTAALRIQALEDLLAGPDLLHGELLGKNAQLQQLRAQFSDARTARDVDAFPAARRRKPPGHGRATTSPSNRLGLVLRAGLGALRQAAPISPGAGARPNVAVPHQEAVWWTLSNLDSALVSSADGTSTAWYQRDPELFRTLLLRSASLHARLWRDWPQLSRVYRAALPSLTSPAHWKATFETSFGDQGAR